MKRIHVVDDNEAFSELVEMVFNAEFEVLKAGDGEQGLKLAHEEKPDVILLDVMMPKISGVEMLRQLQSDMETRAIPVIILTATKFDDSTHTMFKQEPNVRSLLRKPCGMESLKSEVEKVLNGKAAGN